MNGEGWPLTATYRDGQAFNARTNITNLSADLGATANYNPSRFTWLNFKTTIGTQYNNFRLDQNSAGGTTLPPGAVTASVRRDAERQRRVHDSEDVGHLRRGRRRAARSAVPHGRGSLRPEQRVRHEFPARVLSEGQPVVGDLRRGFLPAHNCLHESRSATCSFDSRTARRACSLARTTPSGRSRPVRRASRTPMRRSRRSTRSATTASSPSGRSSGKPASTRSCSATACSST